MTILRAEINSVSVQAETMLIVDEMRDVPSNTFKSLENDYIIKRGYNLASFSKRSFVSSSVKGLICRLDEKFDAVSNVTLR